MLSFGDCSGASFVIFLLTSLLCGMSVSHMDLELIAVNKWETVGSASSDMAETAGDQHTVAK